MRSPTHLCFERLAELENCTKFIYYRVTFCLFAAVAVANVSMLIPACMPVTVAVWCRL